MGSKNILNQKYLLWSSMKNEGEFLIVPRGVLHRPFAEEECSILLFEPSSTLNTGDALNNELTKSVLDWI